jgi:hypothetical protein
MSVIKKERCGRNGRTAQWAMVLVAVLLTMALIPAAEVLADDTDKPTILLLTPAEGQLFSDTSVEVSWSGVVITPALLDHYEVRIDSSSWLNVGQDTQYRTPPLSEGRHTVTVRIFDSMGRNDSMGRAFVVDSKSPALSITSPADGTILPVNNFTLEWTVNDAGSGVYSTSVGIDGEPIPVVPGTTSFALPALSDGTHQLTVTAVDRAGNARSDSIRVVIDTTAPVLSILTPNDQSYHVGSSVRITWSADDAVSGIARYTLQEDTGIWIELGQATQYLFTSMDRSPHTVTVRAYDRAGNMVSSKVTVTMNLDVPVVKITSPADGSLVNAHGLQLRWGSVLGTLDLDHYELSIDGQGWYSVGKYVQMNIDDLSEGAHTFAVKVWCEGGSTAVDTITVIVDTSVPIVRFEDLDGAVFKDPQVNIRWSTAQDNENIQYRICIDDGSWVDLGSATSFRPYDLCDGYHHVNLTARYATGTETTIRATFRIDTQAPDLSIVAPTNRLFDRNHDIIVQWTSEDRGILPTGVDRYTVAVDGGQWVGLGQAASYLLNLTTDGWHTVAVRSYDAAGNFAEASTDIYIDTTRPDVWISAPREDDMFSSGNVTLAWGSSDPTGTVVRSALQLDGGTAVQLDLAGGQYTFNGVPDGTRSLTVTVYDMVGNHRSTMVNFTVDTTAPEVQILTPQVGYTNSTELTFSWQGSDAIGMGYYMVYTAGTWDYYGTGTSVRLTGLADGTYYLGVIAYDLAGNSGIATTTVVVDTEDPVVVSYAPSGNDSRLNIMPSVEFDGMMGQVILTLSTDQGTEELRFLNLTEVTASVDLLPSTLYRVNVTGTDLTGNQLEPFEWSFTTRSTDAPGPVTHLAVKPGSSNIMVSWRAPLDDNGFAVTDYLVYRQSGDAPVLLATLDWRTLSYTDGTAEPGLSYTYSVVAENERGASDPVVSDRVSLLSNDLLLWMAILAIVVAAAGGGAYLFFRNKKVGEGGAAVAPSPLPTGEPRAAKLAAARTVSPAVEPLSFLKISSEERRAMDHSEYLRGRLRELKRSLKAGDIDERRFRVEASPIMDELLDISKTAFSGIKGTMK